MTTYKLHKLSQLMDKDDEGILIQTQEGTEISISIRNGITFVLFPFGNKLVKASEYGYLSTGFGVIEKDI